MKRLIPKAFLLAAFAFAPALPADSQQQGIRRVGEGVILNFQDVDLAYVISSLAQVAGLNVTYSDLPSKMVTVRTVQPISPQQVLALLHDLAASTRRSLRRAS